MDVTTSATTKVLSVHNSTELNSTEDNVAALLPSSLILTYDICVGYITFIIWIVAVPSNLLIISILVRKKHRNHSTSIYFLSLAIADLFVNFRTFTFWLTRSGLVTYTSDFECQIDKGHPLLGMLASSWTLATISVERTICVYLPYRMKTICNVSVARVSVIVIWVMSLCVALLNASIHRIDSNMCVVKKEHHKFFIKHVIYLDYFLDAVLPFFIILVNSIITLVRISTRKPSSGASSKAFGKSVTVLVLVINVVFFVTQVPYGIMFILQQLRDVQTSSKLRLDYYEGITLVLKYVNYALNFYVYFLTASQFRQETKSILISCKQLCSRFGNL